MNIGHMSRSARRFLIDRLERLHTALETLGERLREGIAQLVGGHIGEAVKDALATALLRRPVHLSPHPDHDLRPWHSAALDRHGDHLHDHGYREGFWEEEQESLPAPRPPEPGQPSRWKSLVAGGVHLVTLWYRHRPPRRVLLRFLGLGAVAILVTLVAGTLIGGLVATFGTVSLLTNTADTATEAAESVAVVEAD